MIAYEYVETVYNSNQDSQESMDYDPNLSAVRHSICLEQL